MNRVGIKDESHQIKDESLFVKHILIVSFQIHCGGVQRQNYANCVTVQILMDLTVRLVSEPLTCDSILSLY